MSLNELLSIKKSLRDDDWEQSFFHALSSAKIRVLNQDPQEGPEGFPYLLITTYGQGAEESFQRVAHWCADTGVGLVLNPTDEGEDYLFTFGMLWNYKQSGYFFSGWLHEDNDEPMEQMVIRQMTDMYWPQKPRTIFKEFLLQQNILRPKITLFSKTSTSDPELGFSLESLGNPPEREHTGVLEAFSWFFPRHYSLVLVSEKQMGSQHFMDV